MRDTDGDGVADEGLVFADGFDGVADGIGAGLLEHEGDVYYACIPNLWRLRDTDGDGRADEREVLSSGYGVHVSLLGHDLHGLRLGPDGRLYFSCGDRGFHVETPDGVLAYPDTGGVLRCELDGSGLEVFATGLRNPQETTTPTAATRRASSTSCSAPTAAGAPATSSPTSRACAAPGTTSACGSPGSPAKRRTSSRRSRTSATAPRG